MMGLSSAPQLREDQNWVKKKVGGIINLHMFILYGENIGMKIPTWGGQN